MRCCSRLPALLPTILLAACAIATAGPPEEQLTSDGKLKFTPLFRDDGREIVFVEFVNPTLFQIRRLVPAEGVNEPLYAASSKSEFEPASSADGQCLAFCKTRGTLSISIEIRDRNGKQLGELLPGEGFSGYRSPALAPDHSRVAFSFAEDNTQQIYSAMLNGEDRRRLTEPRGISNWPSYSPDGQFIAFGSSRDGNFEIYVMKADGSDVRRLTKNPLQDIRPRFSPDGRRIAFTSHRDGNAEIYVIDSDGTGLVRVTENEERDDYPDWHPDGERVVFVGERGGKHDLYVIGVPR